MLIDVHTHQDFPESDQELHVFNLIIKDSHPLIPSNGFFSVGIHPWYIPEEIDPLNELLSQLIRNDRCLAIGECGMDKIKGPDLSVQETVFRHQLKMAEKAQKPVIIHAVRTYPEIISLKKEFAPKIPWILHNFNSNQQQLQELLKHGFYFSMGINNLQQMSKKGILHLIPLERVFFETDETQTALRDIYQKLAFETGLGLSGLESLMAANFHNIFLRNSIL